MSAHKNTCTYPVCIILQDAVAPSHTCIHGRLNTQPVAQRKLNHAAAVENALGSN